MTLNHHTQCVQFPPDPFLTVCPCQSVLTPNMFEAMGQPIADWNLKIVSPKYAFFYIN